MCGVALAQPQRYLPWSRSWFNQEEINCWGEVWSSRVGLVRSSHLSIQLGCDEELLQVV